MVRYSSDSSTDMSTYITPSTQGASMIASVVTIYKSIYDTPNTHDDPTVVWAITLFSGAQHGWKLRIMGRQTTTCKQKKFYNKLPYIHLLNGLPVIVQHCTTISKLEAAALKWRLALRRDSQVQTAGIGMMTGAGVKKAGHPALWLFHQKVCPFLRFYFGEDLGTYL